MSTTTNDTDFQTESNSNNLIAPTVTATSVALADGNVVANTLTTDSIVVIDDSNNKAGTSVQLDDEDSNIQTGGGVSNIYTGNGNSTITAATGINTISVRNGNNDITVANGNNTITTGDGINNITAGDGFNYITTGENKNTITTGNGTSIINLGNGTKTSDYYSNEVTVGEGNNIITTGSGTNMINVGLGHNQIYSNGHDIITSYPRNNQTEEQYFTAFQSVTLAGGQSQVGMYSGAYITDLNGYNNIMVSKNSIINGGDRNTIQFRAEGQRSTYVDSNDSLINATNTTVSAALANLNVSGGSGNVIAQVFQDLTLSNTTGETIVNYVAGNADLQGEDGLNLKFHAGTYSIYGENNNRNVFTAGAGNETLNAGTYDYTFTNYNIGSNVPSYVSQYTQEESTGAIEVNANTVTGAQSSLVAITGSGDDTLNAGTGHSTFTGGTGANLFSFIKENAMGGSTIITDFSASEDNQIALFDYGLTRASMSQLLKNSHNDARGDAVINLDSHTITLQGVSVSDLSVNQFFVFNAK